MGLYEDLKAKEPFSLSMHDDADGIYSASLLIKMFQIKDLEENGSKRPWLSCPPFNEYKTDVAVDLGFPSDKEWTGIIIDHHPDHPLPIARKYKLYWGTHPTGLVIYENMKDIIPKEHLWRVAGSTVGDGQAELIPIEIWDMYPELMDEKGTVYKSYKGDMAFSKYPVWSYLSSGINALCRLGNPIGALKMCLGWNSPMDAVTSSEAQEAKNFLAIEENNIMKQKPIAEIIKNRFCIIRFRTTGNYGMSGRLASALAGGHKFLTLVLVNETNGEVSIRGTLAKYIATKLSNIGYKAGGHAAFCGATVEVDKIDKFVSDIRRLS